MISFNANAAPLCSLADVFIQRVDYDALKVLEALAFAANQMRDCRILEPESTEYTRAIDGEGLLIRSEFHDLQPATLAFASEHHKRKQVHLTNIVPTNVSELSISEYNAIAKEFVRKLRRLSRTWRLGLRCRVDTPKVPTTLRGIIPGDRTRALFVAFASCANVGSIGRISHPYDLDRLDTFICAVHKYGARVDRDALHLWLIRERQWPTDTANWLLARLDAGLNILRINHRF